MTQTDMQNATQPTRKSVSAFRHSTRMFQFHRSLLRRPETRLIMLVITIGMMALSAVQMLIVRLDRGLVLEATHWVGADLAINSTQPIPQTWIDQAQASGFKHTLTAEFPSVVFTDDHLKLAAIKAVGPGYPLKGEVKTSLKNLAPENDWQRHAVGPKPGTAWVENGIIQALNMGTGDSFSLGQQRLSAESLLQYEPDRHTNFYSFSPRVLISWADLEASKVIQPGSRVKYRLLLALADETALGTTTGNQTLLEFETWMGTQLRPGDKIVTAADDRPTLSRANDRLKLFLNTSLWLTLSMTLVAIALACQHLCHSLFPTFRTLFFLGLRPSALYAWFGFGLLAACLMASILGAALGGYIQTFLANTFALRLPPTLDTISLNTYLLAFGYGVATPMCMGLASFHTHLKDLLKPRTQDAAGTPHLPGLELLATLLKNPFICALLIVLILLLNNTLNGWKLSAAVIAGISILSAVLYLLFQGLLNVWLKRSKSAPARLATLNLVRLPQLHFFQMLAFVVTVLSGSLAWSLGQGILTSWQTDLPPDTPNVFVINLLPTDKDAFAQQLEDAKVPAPNFYPIVRGRLTAINDTLLQQTSATKEKDARSQSEALQRDLNFTWQAQAPTDSPILAGQWWPESKASLAQTDVPDVSVKEKEKEKEKPYQVSVESEIAKRLDLSIGDNLTVTIGARSLTAQVSSLREVTWENFQPNFYFIFEPRALQDFAHTYMGSLYLQPEQSHLLPALANQFSSVNFFDVKTLLKQADTLLQNLGQAIWVFGGLTGLIGMIILIICSLHRQALLKSLGTTLLALGATLNWQKRMLNSEALILWTLSISLGFILAEAIRLALATLVFDMAWQPAFVPVLFVGGLLGLCWSALTAQQVRALAKDNLNTNLRR